MTNISVISRKPNLPAFFTALFWLINLGGIIFLVSKLNVQNDLENQTTALIEQNEKIQLALQLENRAGVDNPTVAELQELSQQVNWYNQNICLLYTSPSPRDA